MRIIAVSATLVIGLGAHSAMAQPGFGGGDLRLSAASNGVSDRASDDTPGLRLFEFRSVDTGASNLRDGVGADVLSISGLRLGTLATLPPVGMPDPATLGLAGTPSGDVGAFAEYSLEDFKVTATARHGLATGGAQVEVGFGYGAKLSPSVSLSAGPALSWTSGNFRDSLFGLEAIQGGRSDGEGAFDLGASVVVNWNFLDSWSVTGFAGAKQFLSDSPFAAVEPQNQPEFFTGLSLGYRF